MSNVFRVHAIVNESERKTLRIPAANPAEAAKVALEKLREDEGISIIRVLKTKLCHD